ncbi:response regulator [Corynebacterium epidermidicanis]|uniref:Two component transcriptional regulator, LuxR family n=1 Tax=Corynebacterium epidermidicanis TaxID=1050174 RepID=A0A0G3GQX5_9CORY|nr:response regulator transcription factor [Corynebacterium epidermidicanis]AKK01968.1 two component transcriptional regulator, LuxR family [Corynebacterium epidermidicanis]
MKIALVDDQVLFLHGISQVINSQPDMEVSWHATNGIEALEKAAQQPVDIVVMDVQMPLLDGIEATSQLADIAPDITTIILTTFDDEEYVLGGLAAGASGFILKDAEPEVLLESIRTVYQGDAVISPRATNRVITRLQGRQEDRVQIAPADQQALRELTNREHEILVAIAKGWTNGEICERFFISMPTVKTHVGRVMVKTGSRDRVHAALFAYRAGLVSREDLLES